MYGGRRSAGKAKGGRLLGEKEAGRCGISALCLADCGLKTLAVFNAAKNVVT